MSQPSAMAGLSAVASNYPIILCDIWGVLHNGLKSWPKAVNALAEYRKTGGHVALVTNAPRPRGPIIDMLDRLGVSRDAWDVIVSSGDVTRTLIAEYEGGVVHHVGPSMDLPLFEGIDVERGSAEQAAAVIVTDLDDDATETPDDYHDRMALWLERDLPLICANPDKMVEVGNRMVWCGGALAELYEQKGGKVLMAGKPYAPIYDEALRLLYEKGARRVGRDKMLAIGDAVRTDAMGAAAQDVDFLFITSSVHGKEFRNSTDPDQLAQTLIAPSGARMIAHMPQLVW